MVTQGLAVADTRSSLADRLDRIADDIDDETAKVSGGLILIGGAVALINPLLGVGIAAKALLPAVGAKAMKVGTEYIGEKLRTWSRSSAESRIRSEVVGKMSKLEPEVVANPLLRAFAMVKANRGGQEPTLTEEIARVPQCQPDKGKEISFCKH